jgi:GTPase SAR1 family protein
VDSIHQPLVFSLVILVSSLFDMGGCTSRDDVPIGDTARGSKYKESLATAASRNEDQAPAGKILLLGSGESGKSTIFKQLVQRYGGAGYSEETRAAYRPAIVANVLLNMRMLVQQSVALHTPIFPTRYSESLAADAAVILAARPSAVPQADDSDSSAQLPPLLSESLAASISRLWDDGGIQRTFSMRSRFQLPDCADYFLSRVADLTKLGYVPTFDDVCHVRARTVGVVSATLKAAKPAPLQLVDVGGQRSERGSWFHVFPDVSVLLFVVSLAEYDLTLAEGPSVALPPDGSSLDAPQAPNRMHDSLTLFGEICSSKFFQKSSIVLLLNKSDLFRTKIECVDGTSTPLSQIFPEYERGATDVAAATAFIKTQFLAQVKRPVSTHVLCATDGANVEEVYRRVQELIKKNPSQ